MQKNNQNKKVGMTMFDLSAAFDTVELDKGEKKSQDRYIESLMI